MNIVSLSYQSKRIPIKEPSRTLIKNGGFFDNKIGLALSKN